MRKEDLIDELLARHFAGESVGMEEERILQEWIDSHEEEYRRMKALIQTPLAPERDFDASQAWKRLEPRLEKRGVRSMKLRPYVYGIAAVLVSLLVMAPFFLWKGQQSEELLKYANNGSVEQRIWLPDSSELVLFPGASLAYQSPESSGKRKTDLKGKAFFSVRRIPEQPFVVKSGRLEVEVLGTSFLVDALHENRSGVYVETGKVRVSLDDQQVVLKENERVECDGRSMNKATITRPSDVFANRGRILYFSQTPLLEAVQLIESREGIEIRVAEGLESNQITSRMELGRPEEILSELAFLCRCQWQTVIPGKKYMLTLSSEK